MNEQWYVSRGGKRYGPYRREELAQHARSGNVVPTDLVWSESTDGWVRADQVPGLLPTAPARPSGAKPTERRGHGKKVATLTCGGVAALLLVAGCIAAGLLLWRPGAGTDEIVKVAEEGDLVWEVAEVPDLLDAQDDPDWQDYPDREAEETAISRTLESFAQALKDGNADAAAGFVVDERQDGYRELFASNPEAMASFGDLISGGKMSFLSEVSEAEPYNRTAEYAVELDGVTFYVVLMKVGDAWSLYDF
jgi:hypothetical protein